MEKFKIIIAGGRTFEDYDYLEKCVKEHFSAIENKNIEIVSGGAKGVDKMGERFAYENYFTCTIFEADWASFGRSAGPKRNAQMAEYATHLIAFWDGESKGTMSMIKLAKKNNLDVKVFYTTRE